jgi:hypothetical protein
MEAVVEKALDALAEFEDVNHREAPRVAVYVAAKELGVEADSETLDALASRVLEEGRLWQREVLQRVWSVLGISPPPWAEDRLTPGKTSRAWPVARVSFSQGPKRAGVRVSFSYRSFAVPLPKNHPFEPFAIVAWPGGMEVEIAQRLRARRGWAYMTADSSQEIERVLRGVRPFAPLLALLGLTGLEEALLALKGLGDGKAHQEGAYLLAREGNTRVLFKGSLTGDPGLDVPLLLGKEAVLLGTGGVRVRLRAKVESRGAPRLEIEKGVLEWDGERTPFIGGWEKSSLHKRDAFPRLLRKALRTALAAGPAPSPRTRALVEELTAGENPLEALRARDLPKRVHLRLLSWH